MSTSKANEEREWELYDRKFNELETRFDTDDGEELQKFADDAEELLEDGKLPWYHRIRLLVLVGTGCNDARDADGYRLAAHMVWVMSRQANPKGADQSIDFMLEELRKCIDHLENALEEEMKGEEKEAKKESKTDEGILQ